MNGTNEWTDIFYYKLSAPAARKDNTLRNISSRSILTSRNQGKELYEFTHPSVTKRFQGDPSQLLQNHFGDR